MSTKAKATLALTTVFTAAIVYGVHYQQMSEKEACLHYLCFASLNAPLFIIMRAGILRDEERLAKKKQQESNVLDLAVQQELERRMLQEQTLRKPEDGSQ
ncbi:hypothetical protein BGW42_000527 [Actinomortierella wolfii]|nr:hypothetical protein BGW42_000527 [Actinomortierella wolfii]